MKYTEEQMRELYEEYLKGTTVKEVAERANIPLPTLSFWFKKLGLPVDNSKSHGKLPTEELRARKNEWYQKNKDSILARQAAKYQEKRNDPEFKAKTQAFRDGNKEYRKQYYRDNLEYFKEKAKENYNPGGKHGISKEQYQEYMSAGKCGICGSAQKLKLDHCHATNRIRGPLCHHCNVGLGHFNDDVDRLKVAITYLESHKALASVV